MKGYKVLGSDKEELKGTESGLYRLCLTEAEAKTELKRWGNSFKFAWILPYEIGRCPRCDGIEEQSYLDQSGICLGCEEYIFETKHELYKGDEDD